MNLKFFPKLHNSQKAHKKEPIRPSGQCWTVVYSKNWNQTAKDSPKTICQIISNMHWILIQKSSQKCSKVWSQKSTKQISLDCRVSNSLLKLLHLLLIVSRYFIEVWAFAFFLDQTVEDVKKSAYVWQLVSWKA